MADNLEKPKAVPPKDVPITEAPTPSAPPLQAEWQRTQDSLKHQPESVTGITSDKGGPGETKKSGIQRDDKINEAVKKDAHRKEHQTAHLLHSVEIAGVPDGPGSKSIKKPGDPVPEKENAPRVKGSEQAVTSSASTPTYASNDQDPARGKVETGLARKPPVESSPESPVQPAQPELKPLPDVTHDARNDLQAKLNHNETSVSDWLKAQGKVSPDGVTELNPADPNSNFKTVALKVDANGNLTIDSDKTVLSERANAKDRDALIEGLKNGTIPLETIKSGNTEKRVYLDGKVETSYSPPREDGLKMETSTRDASERRYASGITVGYKGDEKQPSSINYGHGKWEAANEAKTEWERTDASGKKHHWEGTVKLENGIVTEGYKSGLEVQKSGVFLKPAPIHQHNGAVITTDFDYKKLTTFQEASGKVWELKDGKFRNGDETRFLAKDNRDEYILVAPARDPGTAGGTLQQHPLEIKHIDGPVLRLATRHAEEKFTLEPAIRSGNSNQKMDDKPPEGYQLKLDRNGNEILVATPGSAQFNGVPPNPFNVNFNGFNSSSERRPSLSLETESDRSLEQHNQSDGSKVTLKHDFGMAYGRIVTFEEAPKPGQDRGKVWNFRDDKLFHNGNEACTLTMDKGEFKLIPCAKTKHEETVPKETPVVPGQMLATALDVLSAVHEKDGAKINQILEHKTDAERKEIAHQFGGRDKLRDAVNEFEKGAAFDRFENILDRQDGNRDNYYARRIHEDLLELRDPEAVRSKSEIEKDIRLVLSTQSTDGHIASMRNEYEETYNFSLEGAIRSAHLSPETRDTSEIYLTRKDNNDQDAAYKIIDIALKAQRPDLFAEAMAAVSDDNRKDFLDHGGEKLIDHHAEKNNRGRGGERIVGGGGEKLIYDAFYHFWSTGNYERAISEARNGHLDAAEMIRTSIPTFGHDYEAVDRIVSGPALSNEQRRLFSIGKSLDYQRELPELQSRADLEALSEAEKKNALSVYRNLSSAMSEATDHNNPTLLRKWEDMIVQKGGSFVSELAKERSSWVNAGPSADCLNRIRSDIGNMSKTQWEDAKQNYADRHRDLDIMLMSFHMSEKDKSQVLSDFEHRMKYSSYEEARVGCSRGVLSEIESHSHFYGGEPGPIYDAIKNMTPQEQRDCREKKEFAERVAQDIKSAGLQRGDESHALRMLQLVIDGKSATSDPLNRLEDLKDAGASTPDIVRMVEKALADPDFFQRIHNPQTVEDRQYASEFGEKFGDVFRSDLELEQIGTPLFEKGKLSLEEKMQMYTFHHPKDYDNAIKDILNDPEKQKLLNPEYANRVLGFMDANAKEIVMATLNQTALNPEDKIRLLCVTSKDNDKILKELPKADMKAYSRKYNKQLDNDVLGVLDKEHAQKAEVIFVRERGFSKDIQAGIANDQAERSASGIGAKVLELAGSSTVSMLHDDQVQVVQKLSEMHQVQDAVAVLRDKATPEQLRALDQKLKELDDWIEKQCKDRDSLVEAKKAAADYISDAAIVALSLSVSGGASAPMLLYLAAAGAGIKCGISEAMEGSDSDNSISGVSRTVLKGALTGATAAIGPEAILSVFRAGGAAASEGANLALTQFGKQFGENILSKEARELVEKDTGTILHRILLGSKKLEAKSFMELAEEAIPSTMAQDLRKEAVSTLANSLAKEVKDRFGTDMAMLAVQHGVKVGAGAIGGGTNGLVDGAYAWDSRKSTSDNLVAMAESVGKNALAGAGGAILSDVAKEVTEGLAAVAGKLLPKVEADATASATKAVAANALSKASQEIEATVENLMPETARAAEDAGSYVLAAGIAMKGQEVASTLGNKLIEFAEDQAKSGVKSQVKNQVKSQILNTVDEFQALVAPPAPNRSNDEEEKPA